MLALWATKSCLRCWVGMTARVLWKWLLRRDLCNHFVRWKAGCLTIFLEFQICLFCSHLRTACLCVLSKATVMWPWVCNFDIFLATVCVFLILAISSTIWSVPSTRRCPCTKMAPWERPSLSVITVPAATSSCSGSFQPKLILWLFFCAGKQWSKLEPLHGPHGDVPLDIASPSLEQGPQNQHFCVELGILSHLLWWRANTRNVSHCLFHYVYKYYPHQHSVDTPVVFRCTIHSHSLFYSY